MDDSPFRFNADIAFPRTAGLPLCHQFPVDCQGNLPVSAFNPVMIPLGTGQVDLPPVLAVLEERGYRGWVGVESITAQREEAAREIASALNQLRG